MSRFNIATYAIDHASNLAIVARHQTAVRACKLILSQGDKIQQCPKPYADLLSGGLFEQILAEIQATWTKHLASLEADSSPEQVTQILDKALRIERLYATLKREHVVIAIETGDSMSPYSVN